MNLSDPDVDRIFQALADRTRRDILERAIEREQSVSALARQYDMSFAAVQKHVAQACRRRRTTLIVATGLFASMRSAEQPGISEVSDAFNAVLDGADYLMLAEESAVGIHPELVVSAVKKVIDAAESYLALNPPIERGTDKRLQQRG